MYNIKVDKLLFEWDVKKASSNIIKHGVSFEEATTAFMDECGVLFDDPNHSEFEERQVLIGMSNSANLLTICNCARDNEKTIRIISARKATAKETKAYLQYNGEENNER